MNERTKVLELFENPESNWKENAEKNILKYRKASAKIKLVDKFGKPIQNAKISVKQKNHEFRFGANCFMLDELETKEKNDLYKAKFAELFNMATLPFYWQDVEPAEGETRYGTDSPKLYRRPPIDLCLQYCEENGIEPREHALAYEHFFPDWLKELPPEKVKEKTERHFKEIARLYGDKISAIEVTNEMFWQNGVTSFYKERDYVEWCFKTARKYFPRNQLIINEFTDYSWENTKYISYITENINNGAPIDAIGLQFHMFFPKKAEYEETRIFYNPEALLKQLELYSEFKKPIQITEITVPAYSNADEDEAIQAKLLEYLYTLWFSSPDIEQIIYWNLVDGYAAFTKQGDMTGGENVYYGGLLRFDMSEKPSYKTLNNLINKKWHTREETVTDCNGIASFNGFYGDYEITVITQREEAVKNITLSSTASKDFTLIV